MFAKILLFPTLCLMLGLLPSVSMAGNSRQQAVIAEVQLSPAQLKEDLQSLRTFIKDTHPDIAHSASVTELEQAFLQIEASLTQPMTANQFWHQAGKLNPLFNDAHWSVNLPQDQTDMQQLIKKTGGVFPLEVHIRPDGELTVLALAGGADTPWRGATIESINGVLAPLVGRQLLALRHGDTPLNRANLLAPSFQLYYASVFGSPAEFKLQLKQNDNISEVTLPASRAVAVIGKTSENFADNFSYGVLDNNSAYLKLGTFSWPDEQEIGVFTKEVFAKIQKSGAKTLVIDVRENRGGNDSVWIDHVLPYLADQPFRVGSHNRKKVIANRASATEPAGLVIESEFKTWYQPQLKNPLRFQGKVVVLTGRRTYSSAVQFCNVMQDFGFATLAGEGSYVRSRSTGGIQFFTLPHSKLDIIVPRFWAARPQGGFTGQLLTPDWLMPDDVTAPNTLIQAVLARSGVR
ncbi:S41 family peptidase [Rheinheimera sp. 4Y26]|uniref:S41 family peptidase n=1 Tax=Rheinheimera sp. 4Y26 TaxID=2977811 RepID=UPI0021B12822|nr:S41 family peptidase [Rheinheimera sp. 4Y26]MCT6698013.1 S41 family peptidase [Rheinheimera sp. 4Y26]